MRSISALFVFVVLATLVGCGGKSGPAEPAQVSAEQEQQLKEQQEKVNVAERQQHWLSPARDASHGIAVPP